MTTFTMTKGTMASAYLPALTRGDEILRIVDEGFWVKATGSRVTSHFDVNSDWDYVVFDPENKLYSKLRKEDWDDTGSDVHEKSFASLRKGLINLILVHSEEQWKKWIIATNLIKVIDPETKDKRIKIFDSVFGNDPNYKAVEF